MLTDEQKYQNKMKYLELLSKLDIDLTEYSAYLDKVGYFEAPYTAQYTGAYAGGLCEYALKLCYELGTLCEAYFPGKYTKQDIITVALLSGLYKAELYELYVKNVKNDTTGQWETQGAYKNKEGRPAYGDIGFASYMLAKKFFVLNDEQIEAIVLNGTVLAYGGTTDIHEIYKQYPLAALTHMALVTINYLQNDK